MIVDAHCHLSLDPAVLARHMIRSKRAGIDRTILLAPHATDYLRTNRLVARMASQYPETFIGFVFVHPERDRGRVAGIVDRAVCDWRCAGIKVHGGDVDMASIAMQSTMFDEICRVASRRRLPVLIDVAGWPRIVERLAANFPNAAIIVAHLGSFADDWTAQRTTMRLMRRFPNVYADTSGVRRFDTVDWAVQFAGPDKVLFGSDGPWLHPELELSKIKLLGLRVADERLILGGNALRLIQKSDLADGTPNRRVLTPTYAAQDRTKPLSIVEG